ncbi:MAG: hypothetical protein JNM93_03425 [Bacteriovoracaceae bacterium]|nr:hypothetical protein [Bacteriovoracaceae bacterium]
MMGSIGSIIMNTLKILTPRAIDELSSKAGLRGKRVSNIEANQISEFMSTNLSSTTSNTVNFDTREKKKKKKKSQQQQVEVPTDEVLPKVIPLNTKLREVHQQEELELKKVAVGENYYQNTEEQNHVKSSSLESIGVMSHEKIQRIEEQKQRTELNKQPTSTIFLLSERDRLKDLNHRIHGQRAIESYKSSIVLDIKADEKHEEEGKSNLTSGVLLDKKQF